MTTVAHTRPRSLTAIGVTLLLLGLLLVPLLWGVAGVLVAESNVTLGLALALFPQALVVGAIGLLRMRKWGLYTVLVALFFSGLAAVVSLAFRPPRPVALLQGALLALSLAGFFWLSLPRNRERFT